MDPSSSDRKESSFSDSSSSQATNLSAPFRFYEDEFSFHQIGLSDQSNQTAMYRSLYAQPEQSNVSSFSGQEPDVFRGSASMPEPDVHGSIHDMTFGSLEQFSQLPQTNHLHPLKAHPSIYGSQQAEQIDLNAAFQNHVSKTVVVVTEETNKIDNVTPPAAPVQYLEPYSHFYVESSNVSDLFSSLRATLHSSEDAMIDCNCHADQFTIHCTTYSDHLSLQFIARIYSTDTPDKYVVELQKRRGDGLMFHCIYKLVEKTLLHHGKSEVSTDSPLDLNALAASLPVPSLSAFRTPELPASFATTSVSDDSHPNSSSHSSPSREDIVETIRCLLDMACSDCADIAINGIAGLASLSSSKCALTRELLSAPEYLSSITPLLSSKCENIHRCALTVLANLSQNSPSVSTFILQQEEAIAQLSKRSQSPTLQVVRETARVINSICSSVPSSQLIQQETVKHTVLRLAQCSDATAKQHATHASNYLTAE